MSKLDSETWGDVADRMSPLEGKNQLEVSTKNSAEALSQALRRRGYYAAFRRSKERFVVHCLGERDDQTPRAIEES